MTRPLNENSGVYQIKNMKNGKSYIGSSIYIKTRFKTHIRDLQQNKHHNIHLQRAWNKYSDPETIFSFLILESGVTKKKILNRETYWINKLKPEYNMGPVGGGDTWSNHPNITLMRNNISGKNHHAWKGGVRNVLCNTCGKKLYSRDGSPRQCKKCYKPQISKKGLKNLVRAGKLKGWNRPHGIIIDGIRYRSIREAARVTGICRLVIGRRLKSGVWNINHKNSSKITNKSGIPRPIMINGITYRSGRAAADALGISAACINGRISRGSLSLEKDNIISNYRIK